MPKPASAMLQTKSVQRWLNRFDANERKAAEFLLANMRFVSSTAMRRGLEKLVLSRARSGIPMALYAVRQLGSNECYFPGPGTAPDRSSIRPSRTVPGEEVGSEGMVANLIRNLARKHPSVCLDHPSPKELRDRRCPQILLLDDVLSTSGRLERFLTHLRTYKWLKSWHSFKWVKLTVIVYCSSEKGEQNLREKFHDLLDDVDFQVRPQLGVNWWPEARLKSIKALCEKTARKAGINEYRLGRREGLGTILFESGCTSISPPILWEKTDAWEPLFPDRTLPDDVLEALTSPTPRRKSILVASVPETIPSPAMKYATPAWAMGDENMLMVLSAASKRLRKTEQVAAWTGLAKSDCIAVSRRCIRAGFLDTECRLTELGKEELRRLRRAASSQPQKHLQRPNELFYYPTQLRRTKSPTS